MGINAYCRRVRYVLRSRADGEGGRGRGGREAVVTSSIEVVVAIAIHTPPLMALHHIWGLVLRYVSPCSQALRMPRVRLDSSQLRCEDSY